MAARQFLFAADDEAAALTRLIASAARVTGFMDGAPGPWLPGWHQLGRDNHMLLETLRHRLAAAYPQAGPPFYAVRLWTNLLWQPCYLAVIAVHVHGALPELGGLAQSVRGVDVSGYRLAPGPQQAGSPEALIAIAGRQLNAMSEAILTEINAVTRLKRRPARRLLADRMLDLMVRLDRFSPGTGLAQQQRFCALWLEAMGLAGEGELETLSLADGTAVPIIARKGCCLDYLAFPGSYCASCPRQADEVRRARQAAAALAERETAD